MQDLVMDLWNAECAPLVNVATSMLWCIPFLFGLLAVSLNAELEAVGVPNHHYDVVNVGGVGGLYVKKETYLPPLFPLALSCSLLRCLL